MGMVQYVHQSGQTAESSYDITIKVINGGWLMIQDLYSFFKGSNYESLRRVKGFRVK